MNSVLETDIRTLCDLVQRIQDENDVIEPFPTHGMKAVIMNAVVLAARIKAQLTEHENEGKNTEGITK